MLALLLAAVMAWPAVAGKAAQDAPRVLLDQSPRVVEYQLGRLSNDQLVRVERRDTDDKYRPVYAAILSRKGMARPARVEALSALVKMGNTSATRVLLDALARMSDEDMQNAGTLVDILLEQPADVLRPQRESLTEAVDASQPAMLRGIYGALMIADGDPAPAWQAAAKHEGHLVELLRSVPHLGKSDALRAALFTPVSALLAGTGAPATRVAAVEALAWTRRDGATFDLLAREILEGSDAEIRAAAIRSVQFLPEAVWTPSMIEPLARGIVAMVRSTPSDRRTEPPAIDALQLGGRLASLLPAASRLEVRRDLRALGVQVVLANPDAMPHNLVIGQPGSLQEIGIKGAAMPPADPADSRAKAYVPDSPLVLHATRLLNGGDTERLTFTAPAKPGEYVFLCTFPGHFVRMYGVMLVVENLEAWEAKPTVPTDPVTNKPFPPK